MEKVAVVIPVYKENLSDLEEISLVQAMKILKRYDKFFVLPNSLEFNYFYNDVERIYFEDKWFKDTKSYSRLLLDDKFYRRFIKYKYILIYQLDAFVFRDELEYFCDLGYDYIGAPWISKPQYIWRDKMHILSVGNGGLSLRNVEKCAKLISRNQGSIPIDINEDIFFAMGNLNDFNVASMEVALKFSFEREIKECFRLNKNKIPFGCHAWQKYNLEFWKLYIEKFGYKINEKYLIKGNEDFILANELDNDRKNAFFWEHIYTEERMSEFIREKKRKIYIWGAGEKGRFLGQLLNEADLNIEGYLDNNLALIGTYVYRYKVLSIEEIKSNAMDIYIIIATDVYKEDISKQLMEMGYRYEIDYVFYTDVFHMIEEKYFLDNVIG